MKYLLVFHNFRKIIVLVSLFCKTCFLFFMFSNVVLLCFMFFIFFFVVFNCVHVFVLFFWFFHMNFIGFSCCSLRFMCFACIFLFLMFFYKQHIKNTQMNLVFHEFKQTYHAILGFYPEMAGNYCQLSFSVGEHMRWHEFLAISS